MSNHFFTDEYYEQAKELHQRLPKYGANGHKWVHGLKAMIKRYGGDSILDYGCGKGTLKAAYDGICGSLPFYRYEPCIEPIVDERQPCDIVMCTHVLEHIEPHLLDDVIHDIARLTKKACFISVSYSYDSHKKLSDGRDSNLVVLKPEEWHNRLTSITDMKSIMVERRVFRTGVIDPIDVYFDVDFDVILEA